MVIMGICLAESEVLSQLSKLTDWNYDVDKKIIFKKYLFKSYLKNISFVNALAWEANKRMHHPDLEVSYNFCLVKLTTHDEGGVTQRDLDFAKAIDQLF